MSEKDVKDTVLKVLAQNININKYRVYLFGSRATGYAQKWSDYDIGIEGIKPIPRSIIGLINSDLAESNLPVHTEVVDFKQVNNRFKKFALKNAKIWKTL